jgi:hypothetical protein
VSQDEYARLRESVPYVKVYRYNPKHLYPKLNGYGDNGQRKVWSSSGSAYCTCSADALSHPAHVVGLDKNAQSAKLKSVLQYSWISNAMYSAWNHKDNYGISASVYVLQFNGFMSLMGHSMSSEPNF